MARQLKYRFDLIPAGETATYEGATLGDIRRRLKGYTARLPVDHDRPPAVFHSRAVDGGVTVERLS